MAKMIRTMALSGAAAAALVSVSMMSTSAQAADLDMYVAPPPPPPVMTWTGPYIGGFIGGGAHNAELSPSDDDVPGGSIDGLGGDGFMYGGFVGYNFQLSPQFVLGVQGDLTVPDFETDFGVGVPGAGLKIENDIVWSLSARAGWLPADNTMLYVIGGWSNTKYELRGGGEKFKETYNGWHVGAGIETKLTDAVTARVEYRYTDFGSETFSAGGPGGPGGDDFGLDLEPVTHTGMVGIAYNFGSLF